MAAQYPRVRARLVALLPSLSGWSGVAVYDGQADTGDTPLAFAEVGFVDGTDEGGAGSVLALDGYRYVETGDVNLTVTCITGDDDPTGPQAQAFALFDALDAYVRTDRKIGRVRPVRRSPAHLLRRRTRLRAGPPGARDERRGARLPRRRTGRAGRHQNRSQEGRC
jgi:hypothetical protein